MAAYANSYFAVNNGGISKNLFTVNNGGKKNFAVNNGGIKKFCGRVVSVRSSYSVLIV